MISRLVNTRWLSYGLALLRGKALAVCLALTTPAWGGEVTVLALGDSLTQGYGLPQGKGFVPQLQAWLDARGHDATVVNGGVSGDTTAGGAARVDWSLTPEVDAMIVALGGNDMLRAIAPQEVRRNLAAILAAAAAQEVPVLLAGMRAPSNYGPDYKRAFDAIYPDLAGKYGTLYIANFLAGLGAQDPAAAREFLQADGIHPNAEGVRRIVAAVGPAVADLVERAKK